MKNKYFSINRLNFPYVDHQYNRTYFNERCVEVALGAWFVNRCKNDCVEVGAVMPYYGVACPVVIDISDPHPKVLKMNALDYSYKDKNVLSISTVEHFKTSEYLNRTDSDSSAFMQKIAKESKNYLITWGLGYNLFLDAWLELSRLRYNVLTKVAGENWCVAESKRLSHIYDYTRCSATAICVVTNLTELL